MHDFILECPTHGEIALVAASQIKIAKCSQCDAALQVTDAGAHDAANYEGA